MTARYDTLVIKNTKSKDIPRQVNGDDVMAWYRGHGLRQLDVLHQFVEDLATGQYAYAHEDLEIEAGEILARSRAARDAYED
jgi:hypothetical protein